MAFLEVLIGTPMTGGVPEAPNDGEQYGRQNETWTPISQTGGGVDSVTGDGVGGTPTNPVMSFPTASDLALTTDDISNESSFSGATQTEVNEEISTGLDGLGKVDSVVAGSNVTVNSVDPKNPIVSAFSTTTAGVLDRTYYTGDEIVLNSGTFYLSNLDDKGTVESVAELVLVNDGEKKFFLQDIISEPYPIDTTVYKGSYSGIISAKVDTNNAEQKFFIEIYKTDLDGVPVESGIVGQPVGELGVQVIAVSESGIIDLQSGNESQVNVTAELTADLSLTTLNRIRYHVGVEKISNNGANVGVTVYYGSDHVSHLDIPVQALTNTVINTDLTAFPNSATQYDINRELKTNVENKIKATDYASPTVGGTLKARLNGTDLYLTDNGSDA